MKTEKNENVKEAVNELRGLSEDEKEQRIADLREKYILDRNTLLHSGYIDGIAEGEKRSIEKGKNENSKEIAKRMKDAKADIDFISKMTGLTKEEIEKL